MEQAKRKIAEHLSEDHSQTSESEKTDKLKVEINTMLHVYLPGNITIEQAEAFAITILDMIMWPEGYLPPPPQNTQP